MNFLRIILKSRYKADLKVSCLEHRVTRNYELGYSKKITYRLGAEKTLQFILGLSKDERKIPSLSNDPSMPRQARHKKLTGLLCDFEKLFLAKSLIVFFWISIPANKILRHEYFDELINHNQIQKAIYRNLTNDLFSAKSAYETKSPSTESRLASAARMSQHI